LPTSISVIFIWYRMRQLVWCLAWRSSSWPHYAGACDTLMAATVSEWLARQRCWFGSVSLSARHCATLPSWPDFCVPRLPTAATAATAGRRQSRHILQCLVSGALTVSMAPESGNNYSQPSNYQNYHYHHSIASSRPTTSRLVCSLQLYRVVVSAPKSYLSSHSFRVKCKNELYSLHRFCSLISFLSENHHLYADDTQLFV